MAMGDELIEIGREELAELLKILPVDVIEGSQFGAVDIKHTYDLG